MDCWWQVGLMDIKRINAQENEGFVPFLETLRSIFTSWHSTVDQKPDLGEIVSLIHLTFASRSAVAFSRLSGFCLQKCSFAESLTYILIRHEAEPFGLWVRTKRHITGSTMLPLFSLCLSVSLIDLMETGILNEQRVTYLHSLISSNHQWGGWQLMTCKELLIYVSGEINRSILWAWYMVLNFIFKIQTAV